MVQIVAPAAASPVLADGDVAADGPAVRAGWAARIIPGIERHAPLWSAGAATVVVVGGLVGALAWSGGNDAGMPPGVATANDGADFVNKYDDLLAAADDGDLAAGEAVTLPAIEAEVVAAAHDDSLADAAALPALPALPPSDSRAEPSIHPADVARSPLEDARTPEEERSRTLELEPIVRDSTPRESGASAADDTTAYDVEPTIEVDRDEVAVQPQATATPAEKTPKQIDVAAQMALEIEAIDAPAITLEQFLAMISDMSAVPIALDDEALAQTKFAVRAKDTTLGKLLADVLQEHDLAYVEHDGELKVVRRPISAP